MTRIILVSGKGGVGKTSFAAATGLAAARLGRKTLVMSFDLAHNLVDAFDLEKGLFSRHGGEPVKVEDNLDIQEISLQDELRRQWGDTYQIIGSMLYGGSMQGVLADETDLLPGMDDLVALNCLREWLERDVYDLIVLDCPPTAEALGFVGFGSILQYYADKRLNFDRSVAKIIRPAALLMDRSLAMFLPEDRHFEVLAGLAARLREVDTALRDPKRTTIRLVSNPERMVIMETKRALMYFSMYGITVDAVLVNRVLPKESTFFSAQLARQYSYLEGIHQDFDPIPVLTTPWMPREVAGRESLRAFAQAAYGERAPADIFTHVPPYEVRKNSDRSYQMLVRLPFTSKEDIKLARSGQQLSIRIGPFRRSLALPRALASLATQGARMEDSRLVISFADDSASEVSSGEAIYSNEA